MEGQLPVKIAELERSKCITYTELWTACFFYGLDPVQGYSVVHSLSMADGGIIKILEVKCW